MKNYFTYKVYYLFKSGLLLLGLVGLHFNQLFAQSTQQVVASKNTQEKTLVQLVKSTYLAGETIWFSLFVVNESSKQLSSLSKIVYAEIINEQGVAVMQQKLQVNNGVAAGAWEIPVQLPSSTYVLRGYVASEKLQPYNIDYKPLYIFNPAILPTGSVFGERPSIDSQFQSNKQVSIVDLDDMKTLKVEGLQKAYKSRQKVKFTLSAPTISSTVAVAVYKYDSFERNGTKVFDEVGIRPKFNLKNESTVQAEQEYFGHQIVGHVVDRITGKPMEGVSVYCSVNGERFYFGSGRSDKAGFVRFDVGKPFGSQQVIVQLPDPKDSTAIVQIQTPYLASTLSFAVDQFLLDQESRKAIEERIQYSNLQKAFKGSSSTFALPNFNDSLPFYGKPDKTYFLDDYTRFNTMEEVLREYVVEVELRKQGQQFKFAVLDLPNKKSFEKNPLVLIDGVPTKDINKVVAFDPLKVKRMDIVSRKFFLGDESFDGIVSLITYNGDLGGFELDEQTLMVDYPGLPLTRQFDAVLFENKAAVESRLPDLRSVLFWSPAQEVKKGRSAELSFFTSDWVGDYIMVVIGVGEKGILVNKTFHFSVIN